MTIKSKSSSFTYSKSGTWQPYVPKLGVASGCRVGPRNHLEKFNVEHLSQKYEPGDKLISHGDRVLPTAAKSAFQQGSLLVDGNMGSPDRRGRKACPRTEKPSRGVFPVEHGNDDVMGPKPNRRFQARIGQGSSSIFHPDDAIRADCSRPNQVMSRPPDCLGRGMEPHQECSSEWKPMMRLSIGSKNMSSVGHGFMPLADANGIRTEPIPASHSVNSASVGYRRACGIQNVPLP